MHQLWQFIAGIGLFLFALHLMESSLKVLAGRTFKVFLRKHTSNTLEALGSSALVTGILQSSSVVIMIILTFVGVGIVSLRNALAVTIGSNFGTTLDSWLVATVGFKIEIDIIALPVIGIAAIVMIFLDSERKVFHLFRFLLGFGFLFLGLDFMKESMTAIFEGFDVAQFEGYPRIVFVALGFVLTSLIQSSSASMAIFLSALHTGAIPFEATVAAVIGSELAGSVKVIIGSIGGIAAKWQLAIGNAVFNFVMCTIAFIFMDGYMFIAGTITGKDQLLQLVAFQSGINLVGVILFAPFLNWFARLLEKYVGGKEKHSSFVIGKELLKVPVMAMDALVQDSELLIHRVLRLNLEAFATDPKMSHARSEIRIAIDERNKKLKSYDKKYDDIKKSEGEILIYALKFKETNPEEKRRIDELLKSIRHAMYSAKSMKDVMHNRIEFHESADDVKFRHYIDFRKRHEDFYKLINKKVNSEKPSDFHSLIHTALEDYNERMVHIVDAAKKEKLSPEDVSSLLNVNRELYTSCKTAVQALQLFHEGDPDNQIGSIP